MNPIVEGKKGLTRSAQMMLNLSMGMVRESKNSHPDLLKSQLEDVISSVSFVDNEGKGLARADAMKSRFESTLKFMEKSEVGITSDSMIHAFKNSLDSEASSALEESLSEENKLFIDNAINNSSEKSQPRKDFGTGGLSM